MRPVQPTPIDRLLGAVTVPILLASVRLQPAVMARPKLSRAAIRMHIAGAGRHFALVRIGVQVSHHHHSREDTLPTASASDKRACACAYKAERRSSSAEAR